MDLENVPENVDQFFFTIEIPYRNIVLPFLFWLKNDNAISNFHNPWKWEWCRPSFVLSLGSPSKDTIISSRFTYLLFLLCFKNFSMIERIEELERRNSDSDAFFTWISRPRKTVLLKNRVFYESSNLRIPASYLCKT